jgi:hypothetical protein
MRRLGILVGFLLVALGAAGGVAQADTTLTGSQLDSCNWLYASNNANVANFESPQRGTWSGQVVWFRTARGNANQGVSGTTSAQDHGNPYANIGDQGYLQCDFTEHWAHNGLSTDYLLIHAWASYKFRGYTVPADPNVPGQKIRQFTAFGTYARQGYNVPIGQPARDDGWSGLGANFSGNPPW